MYVSILQMCYYIAWKEPVMGLEGLKRLARKASLQRPLHDQILSLDAMFEFCEQNIPGIKFIKLLDADAIAHTEELSTRFEQAKTPQSPTSICEPDSLFH